MNRLLTAREAAERLNVSYGTFRNIFATKPETLPKAVTIGKSRRWSEKTIDEWIERKSQET